MAVLRDLLVTFFFFFAVVYSAFETYEAIHHCWRSVDHAIQQIFGSAAEAKPRAEPPPVEQPATVEPPVEQPAEAKPRVEPPVQQD